MEMIENDKQLKNENVVKVVSAKDWLLLVVVSILFFAIIIWLFFGVFEKTVTFDNGVFVVEESAVEIHEPYVGKITEWYFKYESMYVKEGEVIGKVYITSDNNADNRDMDYMRNHSVEIYSSVSGFISQLNVKEWDDVDVSTTLMTVCESKEMKIKNVVVIVDLENYSFLKTGMQATIEYSGNFSKTYGYLTGKITKISDMGYSKREILNMLGNEEMTDFMVKDNIQIYPIMITLDADENGDLIWHPIDKKPIYVLLNEKCNVTITLSKESPIEALLKH